MIFAKDELSGNKRIIKVGVSTHNLVICSLACSIGLALVFAGIETWSAFLLLLFGAIWNFFCDFKKWSALIFSVFVGVLYAHFAFGSGLYVHAVLYLLFYIPMQFSVCLTKFNHLDTGINKDKYLTGSQKYYIILASFCLLVLGLVVSAGIDSEVYFVLDTISALMLGISAFLRNYRYHEYFFVRYIAIFTAALLWFFVITTYGLSPGAIMICIMYVMYLLSDIFGYKEWKKSYEWTQPTVITPEEIEAANKKSEKIKAKKAKLHENEDVVEKKKKTKRSEKDPQIYA